MAKSSRNPKRLNQPKSFNLKQIWDAGPGTPAMRQKGKLCKSARLVEILGLDWFAGNAQLKDFHALSAVKNLAGKEVFGKKAHASKAHSRDHSKYQNHSGPDKRLDDHHIEAWFLQRVGRLIPGDFGMVADLIQERVRRVCRYRIENHRKQGALPPRNDLGCAAGGRQSLFDLLQSFRSRLRCRILGEQKIEFAAIVAILGERRLGARAKSQPVIC